MVVLGVAGYGLGVLTVLGWWLLRRGRVHGTPSDIATFAVLHTIAQASPALRAGLTRESARKTARQLRVLLGAEAIAITDGERLLVWDGAGDEHAVAALAHAGSVLASGRPRVIDSELVGCGDALCRIRTATVVPVTLEGRVAGTLAVYGPSTGTVRVRALGEVACWVAAQLELAELDSSRTRRVEAEMRALRAQISPHFVYNSLTTIASFVRTDPERARELLLDFADFARYSFRNPRDFTTLADELRSIDRYLLLERARFGERLHFSVEVAPEVLPVAVPFLSLQPLVENAIRHGMEPSRERFHIRILAREAAAEAVISVEDDGVGMDPARLRDVLAGQGGPGAGIGLANVDERLRQVYGDDYGLAVETGPGRGTKVRLRVPRSCAGVPAGLLGDSALIT